MNSSPIGATALTPPGPAPPPIRSNKVLLSAELALDHRPVNQRVVHRQDADGGSVFAIRLLQLHELRQNKCADCAARNDIVSGATMRRNGDDYPLLGVVAGQHIAKAAASRDADAELGRASPFGLDAREQDLGRLSASPTPFAGAFDCASMPGIANTAAQKSVKIERMWSSIWQRAAGRLLVASVQPARAVSGGCLSSRCRRTRRSCESFLNQSSSRTESRRAQQ